MTAKVSEVNTLADLFANRASAGRPALLFDEQVYTHADLDAVSNQTAQALIGLGVRPGDIVCQITGSRPELIINLLARFIRPSVGCGSKDGDEAVGFA